MSSHRLSKEQIIRLLGHNTYEEKIKECAVCGATKGIELHHINGNPKYNVPSNLIGLCGRCHNIHHNNNVPIAFIHYEIA